MSILRPHRHPRAAPAGGGSSPHAGLLTAGSLINGRKDFNTLDDIENSKRTGDGEDRRGSRTSVINDLYAVHPRETCLQVPPI